MATITSNPSATSLSSPAAKQYISGLTPTPANQITLGKTYTDPNGQTQTANFDPYTGKTYSPTSPTTNTNQDSPSPTSTPTQNDQAFNAYKAALSDTSGVSTAQNAYNDFIANQSKSVSGLSGQGRGIPLSLIRGQQQALLNQTNPEATRLQNQVGIEQTNRQATVDAAKAGLDYATTEQTLSKPVFGNIGTTGYQLNPTTGQYESIGGTGGGDVNSILGQLAAAGVPVTASSRPGLIAALQGGATPQDIINAQANFAGTKAGATAQATNKSQLRFNPLTGQEEYFTPTVGGGSSGGVKTPSSGVSSGPSIGSIASTSNGATPQQVKAVQQALGITADGIYGTQTKAAVAKFQAANGLPATGVIDSQTLASGQFGVDTNVPNSTSQPSGPDTLPIPTTYAQKSFAQDFTSGNLAKTVNAQNTAVGHLTAAFDLAQELNNISLKPGNAGKNILSTVAGKAAVDNYKQAHQLSSSELDSAYGIGSAGERELTAALGGSNSSPEQLKGFVQTSAALLSSKILSNIQQYKTAYGQNAPINLSWFISPQNQQALAGIGIQLHQDGNNVAAYQLQPDGSYKQI